MPSVAALIGGAVAGWLIASQHEWVIRQQLGYMGSIWWFGWPALAWFGVSFARKTKYFTTALRTITFVVVVSVILAIATSVDWDSDENSGSAPAFEVTTFDQEVTFLRSLVVLGWGISVGLIAGYVKSSNDETVVEEETGRKG